MTRAEAIELVRLRLPIPFEGMARKESAAALVDVLAQLGLLKLDPPAKSAADIITETPYTFTLGGSFMGETQVLGKANAASVLERLRLAGYEIVPKRTTRHVPGAGAMGIVVEEADRPE